MPSIKTHRTQLKKLKQNLSVKTSIKSSITRLRNGIENKNDKAEIESLYRKASSLLDRASKNNVIHKNNASRKKSRLQKLINKNAHISIIGLGYVGLPLLLSLGKEGFKMTGIDIDNNKILMFDI